MRERESTRAHTYRLILVKGAKGDGVTTASKTNLFSGLCANKMIDTLNTERFSILYQKWFKIRATNRGLGNKESGILNQTQVTGVVLVVLRPVSVIWYIF